MPRVLCSAGSFSKTLAGSRALFRLPLITLLLALIMVPAATAETFTATASLSGTTVTASENTVVARVDFGYQFSSIDDLCIQVAFEDDLLDPDEHIAVTPLNRPSPTLEFENPGPEGRASVTMCTPYWSFLFWDGAEDNIEIRMISGSVSISELRVTVTGVRAVDPPTCDAGGPYTAPCMDSRATLQLDGVSTDSNPGDTVTYAWAADCPGAIFDDPASPSPRLTVDSPGCRVDCSVTLTVSDQGGASNSCTSPVTILPSDTRVWRHFDPPAAFTGSTLWSFHDAARNRCMIGLAQGNGQSIWSVTLDDPPAWEQVGYVGGRLQIGSAWAWDPDDDRVLFFGPPPPENGGVLAPAELWSLNLSPTPTWTPVAAEGDWPAARIYSIFTYDPPRRRLILTGGYYVYRVWYCIYDQGIPLCSWCYPPDNDETTYALSMTPTPTWSRLTLPGLRTAEHGAVYDPWYDRLLLFGGAEYEVPECGRYRHSWASTYGLSLSNPTHWELIQPEGTPPRRHGFGMIFHEARNRLLVACGSNWRPDRYYPDLLNDVWELDLSENVWRPIQPRGQLPTGGGVAASAYQSDQDQLWIMSESNHVFWMLGREFATDVLFVGADVRALQDRVTARWQAPRLPDAEGTVWRREANIPWSEQAQVVSDHNGWFEFIDETVVEGHRYAYRLSSNDGGVVAYSPESWVDIPRAAGSPILGVSPNPSTVAPTLWFTLPDRGSAIVELFDVNGRRWFSREVTGDGGRQSLELSRTLVLTPGIYVVRLSGSGGSWIAKAVVVD